jgi:hypothetical protein
LQGKLRANSRKGDGGGTVRNSGSQQRSLCNTTTRTQSSAEKRGRGSIGRCYDTTLIFLEYEIVAMGRWSMNVDVAGMR